ncbi:MAG: Zn-dependent oligopeptidase [Candidatus Nomurabacteria bacterium]|nr:Zn-dependent oligopeptidase [Candidatus Nomurabacteria bacterium]
MKTIPLTEKDFKWVKMTPAQMKKIAVEYIEHKKKAYAEIKSIKKDDRTYLNTLYALERCDDKFESFFSKLAIFSDFSPSKEIREAANTVAIESSQKLVDIEYDKGLFDAVADYYEGNFKKEKKSLRKEDIKLLEETLREYRRMGFALPKAKQNRLKQLLKKLSKLSLDFRKNITDHQDYILGTKEELAGLSERFIESLPQHTDGRYIVTLQYPHIIPFMADAKNREKRKELALKNLQKGGKKNLKILDELVKFRHEIATILGYKHHADFRTENRMAKTGKTVEDFQKSLEKDIVPLAKKDIQQLTEFGKSMGIKKMEFYDMAYLNTQLKKKLYDVDPEVIMSYFPLEHVRTEMFKMFGELFSISIKEYNIKLWHKDAKSYQVNDKNGDLIGYFSMDLFPRVGKNGHAAMHDVVIPHEKEYGSEEYIAPYSSMVCNFPAPSKKSPSLLSIRDVETLFHEFGHCLHMTLSRARLESQAGANVAWDFVETPSQIMENWIWDPKVMERFSKHYITGKKMPKDMIERMVKGRSFQEGSANMRQIMHGKLDMDLHTGKIKNVTEAWRKMNKMYLNIDLPEKETLFPAGFGHLVGYDAGYYSYLWALVYAIDAFESFKTKGNKSVMTNKEIGMKWRKEVLEKGSSEDEIKLITNFLGRKPNQKAFLKELIGK